MQKVSVVQIKTGNEADLPLLQAGELGFATDSQALFIGDGTNNYRVFGLGSDVMAYAATIELDPTKAKVHQTSTINATGNATINALSAGFSGQETRIVIVNDATSGKTITFGTNFKSSGTLTGTTSKTAIVSFVSDGANWYETARVTGM